ARHPRTLLTRVEDIADAEGPTFFRVRDHRARIVRRDDREPAVFDRAERELTRMGHGAGVERRYLVVCLVGAAEKRRGELPRHLSDERRVDTSRFEPRSVFSE